jgi:hypothetical protein
MTVAFVSYSSLELKIPVKDDHRIPLAGFLSEFDAAFGSARYMENAIFGVH